jgi:integrase
MVVGKGGAVGAGAGDENVYTGTQFIIGKQKTAKETGVVTVDVPKELQEVLNTWLEGRKSGLLLGGLTAPSITKHLNGIFKPKKIGVSALRHLYLAKYSGVKAEMMADSKAMRHSVGTALGTYVK